MCGILVGLGACASAVEALRPGIDARGPDASRTVHVKASHALTFHSSVLHLRGTPTSQPRVSAMGNVLCFNGQVFDGLPEVDNDTAALSEALDACCAKDGHLPAVLKSIQGPFALVYLDKERQRLWFGRDMLGRRSLLWRKPTAETPVFILTSVANTDGWEEVPARGIFCLDLPRLTETMDNLEDALSLVPWMDGDGHALLKPLNTHIPSLEELEAVDHWESEPETVDRFSQELNAAMHRRLSNIPPPTTAGAARLGVLFSGGIDCTLLALLADAHLPREEPIDLLNAAFENPRYLKHHALEDPYDVPDRITAKQALTELRRLCPWRDWRLVHVNVPFAESQEAMPHVVSLVRPRESVMDASIALPFWFAARGRGLLDGVPYGSEAVVLLSGLGADEQLGGYARHAAAYSKGGWSGLIRSLQEDVDRIADRNLGRDDRVIGDHGKEVRFPYLDEQVMLYLNALPVHHKVAFHTDTYAQRGVGDKLILRRAAQLKGLVRTSSEPKRAVQFGARTAKMTNNKELGHHTLPAST